jgi:DNA-binding PadR family transcriptional regulator
MNELDELAILAVVAARPSHPYAVLDHLNQAGVTASRSALYRNVDGLIDGGLLAGTLLPGSGGPARRQLALTERGRDRLGWLADRSIRQLPLQSPLFTVALGAAGCIGDGRMDELLATRLGGAARELTACERELSRAEGPARLKYEREAAHLRADVGWLQHTLAGRRAA